MIQPSTIHLLAVLIGALALLTLALAVFLPYGSTRTEARSECAENGRQKVASALAGRIPISEIRDDLIVRRDGSFCAGWECVGVATQFASAERLEALSSALDAFIKGFRHPEIELQFRYVVDHDTPQVLQDRKTSANCANSPATWLEENRLSFWRSAIDAGQVRSIKLIALLSWKPTRTWETRSAISRFAASLWDGLARQGLSKLPNVVRLALSEAKTKTLVQRNRIEHNRLVAEFNQLFGTYRIGLEGFTQVRRLTEPELVHLLYRSFNPADRQAANRNRDVQSLLNTDWSEGVRFLDLGGVLKAVVADYLRNQMAAEVATEGNRLSNRFQQPMTVQIVKVGTNQPLRIFLLNALDLGNGRNQNSQPAASSTFANATTDQTTPSEQSLVSAQTAYIQALETQLADMRAALNGKQPNGQH